MRVCFSAVSGRAGFQSGNLMGHFPILGPAKLTERDDMISLQKHGWLVVVLAGAALAACVQGEQQSRSADSTARNLTLAPTESTAALKDVPAPATEAAKPAPEKKAPVKKPVAAKPAPLMLAAGTRVPATANDTLSTRSAKAGDSFTATVSQDVKDATGRVDPGGRDSLRDDHGGRERGREARAGEEGAREETGCGETGAPDARGGNPRPRHGQRHDLHALGEGRGFVHRDREPGCERCHRASGSRRARQSPGRSRRPRAGPRSQGRRRRRPGRNRLRRNRRP